MKDKILVTGASGFIGSHLVEHLLKEGVSPANLRLLVLPNQSLGNLPQEKFDFVKGDIRNKETIKKAIEGVKTIYHLAAKTVFEGNTYNDFKDVNVEGARNLVEALRNKKIQKFVFFSSIAVFGLPAYCGERINCDETWPKVPAEGYGRTKLEAEKIVIKAHESWGLPYVIIRPTTVYGPRDYQGILELYKAIKGHYFFRIGDGKNKMDYVYVKDLVNGARQAQLHKSKASDFILGADKPTTLDEVVSSIAKSINERVPSWHIPKEIAYPLSYIVNFVSKWLKVRPALFPDRVKIMTTNCYFNSNKAMKLISYRPRTSIKVGTELTGKWLINNNKI